MVHLQDLTSGIPGNPGNPGGGVDALGHRWNRLEG